MKVEAGSGIACEEHVVVRADNHRSLLSTQLEQGAPHGRHRTMGCSARYLPGLCFPIPRSVIASSVGPLF